MALGGGRYATRIIATSRSVNNRPGRLEDWGPPCNFRLHVFAKELRRTLRRGRKFAPQLTQPLLHAWVVKRFQHSGIKLIDDRFRRVLWCKKAGLRSSEATT
jgi:hypothetical protein